MKHYDQKLTDIKEVVQRITEISWKMVLLTPPITFSTPPYSAEMYEMSFSQEVSDDCGFEKHYEYTRPVLFYGPLGNVEKGEVRLVTGSKHISKIEGHNSYGLSSQQTSLRTGTTNSKNPDTTESDNNLQTDRYQARNDRDKRKSQNSEDPYITGEEGQATAQIPEKYLTTI